MLKNPTTRQIALVTALLVAVLYFFILSILNYTGFISISYGKNFIISVVLFITAYSIIIFFVKRFIYRRIKLIYKNIHRFKLSKQDKFTPDDINGNIIEEVEREVSEWVEGQERELQDLKKLEVYRRNFMGNISHELKTPIFNIQGYIHTLLDGGLYDENINLKYLNRAARNSDRLQVIIEDLDAISKLESGELVLELQNFDIKELVTEVFEELEIMASENDINLMFKDGADRTFVVDADRENIRQVLVNLITNSLKYGKKEGHTKVSFYDMDKYVLIEVSDNGIGIAPEHLDHLFDRFYRVDTSRSRALGGSGLGLSIVKHIIEAHQQTINVRSTRELGSTFGFTLAKA